MDDGKLPPEAKANSCTGISFYTSEIVKTNDGKDAIKINSLNPPTPKCLGVSKKLQVRT